MSILSLNNVSISYESVLAVENVSLEVCEGDYFCIVGANGSGKSSLIKAILGLVPLQSGSIKYSIGKDKIAYLPQKNNIPLDLPATIKEIVLTGTQKKGTRLPFYTKADKEDANEAMKQLKIDTLAKKRIGELSGGQQQRVLLARALCRKPKLLILDEPCSGLDEQISESLYNVLTELNREKGVAVLMISHDLDQVNNNATRVAVLNRGLRFCGDVKEFTQYHREGGKL